MSENNSSLPTTRTEVVARARELVPYLRENAARAEEQRRVPVETIKKIQDAGLFRVLTPKRFGGAQLGITAVVEASIEMAKGCVSTGWVYGNLTGHYWILSQFPIVAQEAVYANPRSLVSTVFRLGGNAPERVEGGYRLRGGQGKFCSGIDHADWALVATMPTGEEQRFFLVPKADIEIIDDWHTSGMRGTGSKSILIKDAFIADGFSIPFADVIRGTSPGGAALGIPIFQLPMTALLPLSLVAAPIGAALGAINVFSESTGAKMKSMGEEEMALQASTFARVGEASAMVEAAEALAIRDAEAVDAMRGIEDATNTHKMKIARDYPYIAQTCRRAVNSLMEASGGSSIYNSSEIQRIWRDINGVCGHASFTWDANMASYGRYAFGLPPSKFERKGK